MKYVISKPYEGKALKSFLVKELNLSFDYLVCADGAMIFDKELKCIKLKTLNQDVALKAIKILQDNEYEPYIENGYAITDTVVDCIKISAEYCNTMPRMDLGEHSSIGGLFLYNSLYKAYSLD